MKPVQVGETGPAAVSRNNQAQMNEQAAKSLSYKNRPYINGGKTGLTDYKYNYGEKIGSHPKEILD